LLGALAAIAVAGRKLAAAAAALGLPGNVVATLEAIALR
jgi:hypothetical protein